MDDFQTWRDLNSKAVPEGAEDAELYWPFGFPHDFLIYCRYFSDTLLRKHFPWRRLIALPSFIFNTCAPLYATPVPAAEEAPCVSDQSASDEPDFAAPQKRVSFPTARLAAARSTVRHLFSGPPPAKRAKAETQRPPIELYPQVRSNVCGVGMAMRIIRSLISGSGSYRHNMQSCCRDGSNIIARIFGRRRHKIVFPYFKGLYSSVPQQSALSLAIQSTANHYLSANLHKVSSAARTGNLFLVAAILDSGIAADSRLRLPFDCSQTHLHVAAYFGQLEAMTWMLATNPSLDVRDGSDNTPLHKAVLGRAPDAVKLLISRGAPIEATNCMNETPLIVASKHGRVVAAEILLNAGASTSSRDIEHLRTALHIAISHKHESVALLLVSKSSDLNATDDNLETPLHLAVKKRSYTLVSALLHAGANIESENVDGLTPLHLACSDVDCGECLDALLSAGARVNSIDTLHWGPLHQASRHGCHPALVRLISSGAPVSVVDLELRTPLYLAACGGHEHCIDVLLKASAPVNACDRAKRSSLHIAAIRNHLQIAKHLLASGADVNAKDINLMTPLHFAAQHGHDAVIELLIDSNADIDALDVNQYSALHWAAAKDHLSSAAQLLDAGISAANRTNGSGVAKSRSHLKIADAIDRCGSKEPEAV